MFKSLTTLFLYLVSVASLFATDTNEVQPNTDNRDSILANYRKIIEMEYGGGRLQQWIALDKEFEKASTDIPKFDVTYYSISVDVDFDAKIIYGDVNITGSIISPSTDNIIVDLSDSMRVDSIYTPSGNLSYSHSQDRLEVDLGQELLTDDEFSFNVVYHGTPDSSLWGETFIRTKGLYFIDIGNTTSISTDCESYGARQWWPCNDLPGDKADSVDIFATVDSQYVVSSNGKLISDSYNPFKPKRTVHWREGHPISTYLVTLSAYPYSVATDWYYYSDFDSMPIMYYIVPINYNPTIVSYACTVGIMRRLEGLFGDYPFRDEKYAMTQTGVFTSMENQTNTSLAYEYVPIDFGTILHEMAHQWWGDLVTCANWHHIWLNEGFATYAEALYWDAATGQNSYLAYMDNLKYTDEGSIFIADTANIWSTFDIFVVYYKGAWVLHMLRHAINDDDLFFQIFANYREQYAYKTATTEDFAAVVSATTGHDYTNFFHDWIYNDYMPTYRYARVSEPSPGGGYDIYLNISQVQEASHGIYRMPIDIAFIKGSDNTFYTVDNNKIDQNYVLHCDFRPDLILIDPNKYILRNPNTTGFYSIQIINEELESGTRYSYYCDTVIQKGIFPMEPVTFEIYSGTLPAGLTMDPKSGLVSGAPVEAGEFPLGIRVQYDYDSNNYDTATVIFNVAEGIPVNGDANADGSTNVVDASFIINYIFFDGQEPYIVNLADANGDCRINVVDASYLINYIFFGGVAPKPGCVTD